MRAKKIILAMGFLGLFSFMLFIFSCGKGSESSRHSTTEEHPGHEAIPKEAPTHEHHESMPSAPQKSAPEKTKKVTYYCPMHPEYTSDKPGNCPICGMTLVPAKEEKTQETTKLEEGSFNIPPISLQKIGVTYSKVEYRNLTKEIRIFGRIAYDETRMKEINTKFSGWIESLFVDFTGKPVRKGEPLFSIYSPELVNAQEEYLLAFSMKEKSPSLVEASRQKLAFWDFSDAQIEELERQGKPSKTMTVFSPVNGFVIEKNAVQGKYVSAGETLYRIADIAQVWLVGAVYEEDIPFLSTGLEVFAELPFVHEKIKGRLTYISPYLNEATRTVEVRVTLSNSDFQLRPELYATAFIHVPLAKKLTVPEEAVLFSGKRNIVFVDQGNGVLESREIRTGIHAGEFIEVLSGLSPGERIVTSANFLIDSESKLKLALGKTHAH